MTDDERGGPVPRPPEPDVVVFGGSPAEGLPPRGRLRWLALPVALGGVIVLAVLAHAGPRAAPQARRGSPPPSSAPATTAPAPAPAAPSSPPDVTVTTVGQPLLGVTAGWELFGWGPEGVVRIQLARGRVTRTALPPIASSGPTSFLVGRDWAMVRPLDGVPGYLVRDGRPAALGIAERTGHRRHQAQALEGMGSALCDLGRPGEARQRWRQALAVYEDLGLPEAAVLRHRLQDSRRP